MSTYTVDGSPSPELVAHSGAFAVDAATDRLYRKVSDEDRLVPVGELGVDVGRDTALQVDAEGASGHLVEGGRLLRVDLQSGQTTAVGPVGPGDSGVPLRDLARVEPPHLRQGKLGAAGDRGIPQIESDLGIVFWRAGDPDSELDLGFVLSSGGVNAREGEDFVGGRHRLRFAPGQRRAVVDTALIDDDEVERNDDTETIDGHYVDAPDSMDPRFGFGFGIYEDDTAFEEPTVTVDEAAGEALLTVARPDAFSRTSVVYATTGGSAAEGADYTPVRGVLDFAAGQLSRTVRVPLTDDAASEDVETIGVRLSAPTVTRLVNPLRRSTIRIASDDAGPPSPSPSPPSSSPVPPTSSPVPPSGGVVLAPGPRPPVTVLTRRLRLVRAPVCGCGASPRVASRRGSRSAAPARGG